MFIFAERRLRLLCATIRHRQLFIMISSVDCVSRRRVARKTHSGCVERSISSKQTNRFSTNRRLSRNRRTFKVVTVNTDRFEKGRRRRRRKNRTIREIDRRAEVRRRRAQIGARRWSEPNKCLVVLLGTIRAYLVVLVRLSCASLAFASATPKGAPQVATNSNGFGSVYFANCCGRSRTSAINFDRSCLCIRTFPRVMLVHRLG
jgi:hypothetical protein